MIHVSISRRKEDKAIVAFRVSGHADFDDSGKDIVCAGVSAVTVGTVNAVEKLLKVRPTHSMRKGHLRVELPGEAISGAKAHDVQLIIESMLVMLKTIEQSYGSYIQIDEHVKEGG